MVHVLQAQTSRPLAPLSLQHLPHLDPLALISINQLLSQIRLKSSLIPLKLQTPQLQSLAKTRMVVWFWKLQYLYHWLQWLYSVYGWALNFAAGISLIQKMGNVTPVMISPQRPPVWFSWDSFFRWISLFTGTMQVLQIEMHNICILARDFFLVCVYIVISSGLFMKLIS